MSERVSRLAPSPTGALHLGNARTFLLNWAIARQDGWRLCMRIEDLDSPRVKPGREEEVLETLRWLGLDWDGPLLRQSDSLEPYRAIMDELDARGLVFACARTRREIENAVSAPHPDPHETPYPPSLRPEPREGWSRERPETNYRLLVEPGAIEVDDRLLGRYVHHPAAEVGDFPVWTKRGVPAYQLAVVVDDHRQGVTDVLRGSDLLASAARQHLLYDTLGWPVPHWWHAPLVLGEDGRRLAKRHGDTRLTTYRAEGVAPERVVGLLAEWCGFDAGRTPMSAREFMEGLDRDRLPKEDVTMTATDHAWLMDERA